MMRRLLAVLLLFLLGGLALAANLAYRRNTLLYSVNGAPAWAASYTVTAYETGAVVASASTGTTITVDAGHGFAALDKLIVGTDTSKYRTVSSVTATTVVVSSAVTVSVGDLLVNLGPDTGATSPNYDGSGVSIYSDMDGGSAVTNSRVTANSQGVYSYWYAAGGVWELVRSGAGAVIAVLPDTNSRNIVLGNGRDDDAEIVFDQGTGTDPRLVWDDSASRIEMDFDGTAGSGSDLSIGAGNITLGGLAAVSAQPILFCGAGGSTSGNIASLTLRDTNSAHMFGEVAFQDDSPQDIWAWAQDPAFADVEELRLRRKGQEVCVFYPLSATGSDVLTTFSGSRFRLERSGSYPIELRDTSYSLPNGLWRIVTSGDAWLLNRNTAVAGDFSTNFTAIQVTSSGAVNIGQSTLTAQAGFQVGINGADGQITLYQDDADGTDNTVTINPPATMTANRTYTGVDKDGKLFVGNCYGVAVDMGSVSANSTGSLAIAGTLTGFAANQSCTLTPRAAVEDDIIIKYGIPTTDSMTYYFYNASGGAIDPASVTIDTCCVSY